MQQRFGLYRSTCALAALLSLFALPAAAAADTINLAWDRSPDSTVVGYTVQAFRERLGMGGMRDLIAHRSLEPDEAEGARQAPG